MFTEIFLFEIKATLRKPATYIYFGIFFLLNFFLGLAVSGVFDTSSADTFQIFNSAYAVTGILLGSGILFSLLVSIMLINIVATAIQKDYQYNTHMFFFTKPISKADYFFGRFLAVFFMAALIISGMVLGYYAGTLFGMGTPAMGPFKLMNYLQPYLIFNLPNVFVFSVIFFSLTTYTRTTMAAYVIALILMVVQLLMDGISSDIDKKDLAALLDPTGSLAFNYVTEYWTPFEKNEKLIPFSGKLLYNRLLWLGIAIAICAFSYIRFHFSQFLEPLNIFKRKTEGSKQETPPAIFSLSDIPATQQNFSSKAVLEQLLWITGLESKKIFRNILFLVLCGLMIGVVLLILKVRESTMVEATYLVTYTMIEILQGAIGFFLIIFIIFYSGTSLWREREVKMDELTGASPASNGIFFFSKFLSLTLAVGAVYLFAALAGILIQLYQGVFNIHLGQYFVFIFTGIARQVVLIGFCLAIQTYVGNKFFGFFLCLLPIVILPIIFSYLEWDADLAQFNSSGVGISWSDVKGYGGAFTTWYFYRGYWFSIIAFLILLALLVYPRGKEKAIKKRWQLSSHAFTSRYKVLTYGSVVAAIGFGAFIFYQNRVLVPYTSPKEGQQRTADMEKKYGHYRNLAQPRIAGVSIQVDFFTDKRTFSAKGKYLLINKSGQAIDTFFLEYFGGKKSPYHYPVFAPSAGYKEISNDSLNGVKIVTLNESMQPGDSLYLNFEMYYQPRGLFDKLSSPIEGNGTFINYGYLPTIGYNPDGELMENAARKKYGLPPRPRMAAVDDTLAMRNNILSYNSDWITFEATLSTNEGQIAVAPGYLQKEWKENGRHYFSYTMDSPMMHFYSMLSGRYEILKDKWNDVNIEIYYQKGHEYNLDRMVKAIKRSLDYYTENFGPYQHKQVRILEFPRDRSFAQSFPNTIPFSESIGFISKVKDEPDAIDIPFYVTAHEVAHQWWGHQVAEAKVQGSAMLSESMSQYSALMVMEKEYGPEAMKKFLKREMDKYLLGRTVEGKGEKPLMYVQNQQYIHYNKGSIVFYALKDLIGEQNLNAAIRKYVDKYKFKGPLYANSIALVDEIKAVTPDSLRYAITDMFENITLYENYVKELSFKELTDNTYEVTLTVGSVKFVADSTGKQQKTEVLDLMDIGIFKKNTEKKGPKELPMILQKVWMDAPEKTFTFVVKEKPFSAGIDPYLKLVDRTPDNNTAEFGKTPKVPNLSEDAAPAINFSF
jgi:ABC-2 type transport system permease protein